MKKQNINTLIGKALKSYNAEFTEKKANISHGTHVTYGSTTTSLTSGGTGTAGTSSAVARIDHTHTLPPYPTALKNPYVLNLQFNGTTNQTYDGSSAKTLNITPSAIGAVANSSMAKGGSTFNSITGVTVNIGKTMSSTGYRVSVTPTSDPQGSLGEIWVESKTTTSFVVKCSGSTTTTTFDWIVTI